MKAGGLATWTEADKNKRTLRRDLRPSIGRVRRLCSNRSLKFTHDRFQVHDFFLTLETTPGFILPDMTQGVHIGKAAELAGVSVDTIRFYQKLGLIKRVGRSAGGYRLFDGEQIRDLTFVRHAQELGFSLNEVKELLVLRQKHHACSEVQSMLKRKVGDVQKKINSLSRLEAELCRRAPQLQSRTAPK